MIAETTLDIVVSLFSLVLSCVAVWIVLRDRELLPRLPFVPKPKAKEEPQPQPQGRYPWLHNGEDNESGTSER